jgi:hypothetical protein
MTLLHLCPLQVFLEGWPPKRRSKTTTNTSVGRLLFSGRGDYFCKCANGIKLNSIYFLLWIIKGTPVQSEEFKRGSRMDGPLTHNILILFPF